MINDKRRQLIDNIRIAIANKKTEHDILQTAAQLIDGFSEHYNWTGFYMLRGDYLEVGPFVGPDTPHKQIELNKGICGAAVSQGKTIIVNDVNSDPRYLSCSISTKSEIVIPLIDNGKCLGEIDIDSNEPSYFTSKDKEMLEKIADVIVKRLKQIM